MPTIFPAISEFLRSGPHKLFIGVRSVDAAGRGKFETHDPGTGKAHAEGASGERENVDRAFEVTRKSSRKGGWGTMPANDRSLIWRGRK